MYKRIAAVIFVALASLTLFFTPSYAHEGINYRLPTLESIVPPAFSIIDTKTVDISGRIVTGSNILSLRIDGKPVKFRGSKFTISNLPLSIGKNVFLFEILDSTGKRKFYSYSLYRKEELKDEAGKLLEATGTNETEAKKVPSTDTAIVAEGFTPAVTASNSSPIDIAPAPTPATSGYSIKNDNSQVISVIQQITGGVTTGADAVNNPSSQADVAQTQTPAPNNKEDYYNGEPILSFSSPYKDQIITENALQIGGRFSGTAHVRNITIGGQQCTIDQASSTFTGPTLISPGEARRRNIESDSPDYIIMKVDPVTHSGKNILTAQVTDDSGHVTEEKITFYYYQLFVKLYSTGESYVFPPVYAEKPNDPYHRETDINWWGTVKEIKLENIYAQAFNSDFLREPPFLGWSDINFNFREHFPAGPPFNRYGSAGGFVYGSGISSYCYVSEVPWLMYPVSEPWEYYGRPGRGWGKLITTIHSPPLKERPFIVIFKDCHFIETEPMITGNSQLSLDPSKYKINGKYPLVALFDPAHKLISDPAGGLHQDTVFKRPAYIIMENPNPDTDIDITMEAPAYGISHDDGVSWSYGWYRRSFTCYDMQTLEGDILVDSNNDGFLGGDDNAVEQVAPGCVLWVNDDDDYNESTIHSDDNDPNLASGAADAFDGKINGIRDLEDFMPINLSIPNIKEWTTNQNVKFYLKAKGTGRIRVFERVNDAYLTDLHYAKQQFIKEMEFSIPDKDDKNEIILDPMWFNSEGNFYGIFEGVSTGELKLTLEVELGVGQDKKRVVLDEAVITLKDLNDMYLFCNVRYNTVGYGNAVSSKEIITDNKMQGPEKDNNGIYRYLYNHETGHIYPDNPKEVVFWTHGYYSDAKQAKVVTDTIFKRMYRTGYRGAFIGITWHAHEGWTQLAFNADWINSFQSGQIVADILTTYRNKYPNANINLSAHSLGNNAISYAIRLIAVENAKKPVENKITLNNLILAEAAVPGETFSGYDPKRRGYYFDNMYGIDATVVKKVYNTYSEKDKALKDAWLTNNCLSGLETPLDNDYNLINRNPIGFIFPQEALRAPLGLNAAESGLANFENWSLFLNENNHPYGIRNHGSMMDEYYSDVLNFYEYVLDPERHKKQNGGNK